jgi:hypothetical protein
MPPPSTKNSSTAHPATPHQAHRKRPIRPGVMLYRFGWRIQAHEEIPLRPAGSEPPGLLWRVLDAARSSPSRLNPPKSGLGCRTLGFSGSYSRLNDFPQTIVCGLLHGRRASNRSGSRGTTPTTQAGQMPVNGRDGGGCQFRFAVSGPGERARCISWPGRSWTRRALIPGRFR